MRSILAVKAAALALPMTLAGIQAEAADLYDTLQQNESFSRFIELIDAAGMEGTFRGAGPYTVFAPQNEAFEAAMEGEIDEERAARLVQRHIVVGERLASNAIPETMMTMDGDSVLVALEDGQIKLRAGAEATSPEAEAMTEAARQARDGELPEAEQAAETQERPEGAEERAAAESPELQEGPEERAAAEAAERAEQVEPAAAAGEPINVLRGDIEADNGIIHVVDGLLVTAALGEMRPAPAVEDQPAETEQQLQPEAPEPEEREQPQQQ